MALLALMGPVLLLSCSTNLQAATPTIGIYPNSTPVPPSPTPLPTIVDTGLAYGSPCKPPCWQGLVPGRTLFQEAKPILEEVAASAPVYKLEIWEDDSQGFAFHPPYGTYGIVAGAFESGILTYVFGDIAFDYTVGDVITQFGPPQALYFSGRPPSTNCVSCDRMRGWADTYDPSGFDLLYPEQGVFFRVSHSRLDDGCICSEMRVRFFKYLVPRSTPELLQNNNWGVLPSGTTREDLTEWHGFGGGY